jgi:hypothetical protein
MIRAFFKLKLRDRVVLLSAAIVAIAAVIVFLFNLMNGTVGDGVAFPKSVLKPDGSIQQYRRQTYTELPLDIQFPGTDYGVSVGGSELKPTESGAGFRYTDSIALIAAQIKDGSDTATFVQDNFAKILGLDGAGCNYSVKTSDNGYMNTLKAEYQGGILKTGGLKAYVLTYRIEVDNYVFLLASVTNSADDLRDCFTELNHMYYSLCKYGEAYEPPEDTVSGDAVTISVSDDNVSVIVGAPTVELYGNRDYETYEEVMENREREQYKLRNPNATEIREAIEISKSMSNDTVAFAFEYSYGISTPSEALLYDPSGNSYKPDYFNTDKDGRIVFVVEKPVYGTWTIVVSDDIDMGLYEVHALRYMDYMDAVNETPAAEYDVSEVSTQPVSVRNGQVVEQTTGVPMFPNTVMPVSGNVAPVGE